MLTHNDCRLKIAKARNPESGAKLANNTRLLDRGDHFAVRLHDTDVVCIYPDHHELHTGGWLTSTTKDRINTYSSARVYSERGEWWVWNHRSHARWRFFEGIQVDLDGNVRNPLPDHANDLAAARRRVIDLAVRQYIHGYALRVLTDGLREPGGGDCWACYFQGPNRRGTMEGEPLGFGHYLDHFREGYYVPSLLWNAVQARSYSSPQYVWAMIRDDARRGRLEPLVQELRRYFKRLKPHLYALEFNPDELREAVRQVTTR